MSPTGQPGPTLGAGPRSPVLVAAKRLAPDGSSEGICTARFVEALHGADVPLSVVTGDEAADLASLRRALPGLDVPIRYRPTLPARIGRAEPGRARGALDLAATFVAGYPTWYERSVWAWRRSIAEAVAADDPGVVLTRGAGGGFEPHLAMLGLRPAVPWIAHYHDPWPASCWPAPYRAPLTRAQRLQQRGHRRILERADALTFPSGRLRDWVLGDDAALQAKAHVVPHVADPDEWVTDGDLALVDEALARPFTLVHTGTLLRHRRVDALLAALAAFVATDPARRAATRLVLAGPCLPGALGDGGAILAALEADGVVARYPVRLDRATALALVDGADAAVLVEAASPSSPFFPGKLADYAARGRPILALTPRESVASDLMGDTHPLRVEPDDAPAIEAAIECLWRAHGEGTLDALRLPPAAVAPLYPARVATAFTNVLATLGIAEGTRR